MRALIVFACAAGCGSSSASHDAGADLARGSDGANGDLAAFSDGGAGAGRLSLFVLQDNGNYNALASAYFSRTGNLQPLCPPATTVGACAVLKCDVGRPASDPAGDIALHDVETGAAEALAFPDYYTGVSMAPAWWLSGEHVAVAAPGAIVPAFSATIAMPQPVVMQPAPTTAPRANDLALSWTGGASAGADFVWVFLANNSGWRADCYFPATQNGGTIPSAALQLLPDVYYGIRARTVARQELAVGGWTLTLDGQADAWVMTTNGQPALFGETIQLQ